MDVAAGRVCVAGGWNGVREGVCTVRVPSAGTAVWFLLPGNVTVLFYYYYYYYYYNVYLYLEHTYRRIIINTLKCVRLQRQSNVSPLVNLMINKLKK